MFPIHSVDNLPSAKKFKDRTVGMPDAAIDIIRDLQPYKRGAAYRVDPLWKLNELSNIDKHRIFAVSSNTRSLFAYPAGYTFRVFYNGCEFRWPLALKDSVVFEPYASEFVFGKPVDLPGDLFEIRQKEITQIYRYVRDDVIPRFTRFFP
jgi:hypothetical protein